MKIHVLALFFAVILVSLSLAQTPQVNIIPKPKLVRQESGYFQLSRKTEIVIENKDDQPLANFLNEQLKKHVGFELKIRSKGNRNAILLSEPIVDYSVPEGGYELSIEKDKIRIFASEPAGRFYALQSLFQIIGSAGKDGVKIPLVLIADEPRFPHRGMHLDVGRHFMPVEFVKKYVDLMAQYKFNYFHWHLTEDQGWRIEIKKYPKLNIRS
jgi:hexosaminidase